MCPAPVFDFTDRAVPIVQMGRSVNRTLGNDAWGTARWGSAKWGTQDWEPVWTDLTCEIHEITTDTGRGGATDRFRPGTADIVASNVNQLSELIFPPVPDADIGFRFEYVPQPPIAREEDLQAPTAATIVSNGWSFTDDFETVPPHWMFPAAWATGGTFPCGPFKHLAGDRWAPELYADPALTGGNWFEGSAAAQWTGPYPDTAQLSIQVDPVVWPAATTAGTPSVVFEVYARMNTTTKACQCLRVTYNVGFGATTNTIVFDLFRMGADGSRAAGTTSPYTVTLGAVNGTFPAATYTLHTAATVTGGVYMSVGHNGVFVDDWLDTTPAGGNRIGLFCHVAEGKHTGATVVPAITRITELEFDDDLSRPTGSGWYLPAGWQRQQSASPMIQTGGAMRPPEVFGAVFAGNYRADGAAYFDAAFEGDQFFEFDLAGMSMPDPLFGASETYIEVVLHGNRSNLASIRAIINYVPEWGGSDTTIFWELYQSGPFDGQAWFPDVWGEINLGEIDGVFPEPATWRVESDTVGETRLYLNGTLLGTAVFPEPPTGDQVGVWMLWQGGGPAAGDPRPLCARLERVSAGLREPLGTEELGLWVRIGVDHQTLGAKWFFRGFVDAVVPTYVPDHQDAVRIECIDSLGEAGRVQVDGDRLPHRFAGVPTRIRQILDRAHWPKKFRDIHDDSTVMSRPAPGKAVDLLTHVAESCGGAVYGDPADGDIVFRGQDWQGHAAASEVEAFITNFQPDLDDGIPRVCPVGWERSARRSDMTTRARFTSETSNTPDGEPIVTEWRSAPSEALYGVELYERTLLCITRERLHELNIRQLRLRHPNQFPRIEAVLLDAATADEALDLMTTVTFTRPSPVWCQLRRPDAWVFNRKMLVTGVRHRIRPSQWTCRLALDPASVFAEIGGRWGRARWGRDAWGRTR